MVNNMNLVSHKLEDIYQMKRVFIAIVGTLRFKYLHLFNIDARQEK